MKKLIAILIAALMCTTVFVACTNDDGNVDNNDNNDAVIDDVSDSDVSDNDAIGDEDESNDSVGVADSDAEAETNASLGLANPWSDYATAELAFDAAGFELTFTDTNGIYTATNYRAMAGEMLEFIYTDGQKELTIRKAPGSEDISGDYTDYSEVGTETVGDITVTVKGQNGSVKVCIWTDGDYSYSLVFEEPVLAEYAASLIAGIK